MTHQMWVLPLVRKMERWQGVIARLEHEMRDSWDREEGANQGNNYDRVFKLTEELSKAHQERYKLMKELNKGRP